MQFSLKVLLALSFFAATASAQMWTGDFETGDLSQWSKMQWSGTDRIKVVSDPVQEGRHAARIIVRPGDNPINSSGNRNELVYTADHPQEGDVRWYRWSVLWPSEYRSIDAWQLFTQWHHWIGGGSPPLAFYVRKEEVRLGTPDDILWTAPLERGVWHEFVFGVRWSTDAKVGWVEIEYDGVKVLERTPQQTLLPGTGSVYLKQGLYRSALVNFEQRLFVDGMTIAKTREEVLPPSAFEPEQEPEEEVIEEVLPLAPGEELPANEDAVDSEVTFAPRESCATAALPMPLALLALLFRRRRRG